MKNMHTTQHTLHTTQHTHRLHFRGCSLATRCQHAHFHGFAAKVRHAELFVGLQRVGLQSRVGVSVCL